jgi:hypothetical protein
MLLVFGALPPAVLNYIFAERYRPGAGAVASIVLIGKCCREQEISVRREPRIDSRGRSQDTCIFAADSGRDKLRARSWILPSSRTAASRH